MIRQLAALFAPLMTALGPKGSIVPVAPRRTHMVSGAYNRAARGGGRRRAGRRVPRVGGIAHPPTARLRACGHWGRR